MSGLMFGCEYTIHLAFQVRDEGIAVLDIFLAFLPSNIFQMKDSALTH